MPLKQAFTNGQVMRTLCAHPPTQIHELTLDSEQMGWLEDVDFYLLSAAFVCSLVLVVNATEVGDDDRNGQSDHQHTAQGADRAEDLPGNRLWHHVSISRNETDEENFDKDEIDALRWYSRCTA